VRTSVLHCNNAAEKRPATIGAMEFLHANQAAHPSLTLREAVFYIDYSAKAEKANVTPKSLSSWLTYKKLMED
jgi:hypothetical protein